MLALLLLQNCSWIPNVHRITYSCLFHHIFQHVLSLFSVVRFYYFNKFIFWILFYFFCLFFSFFLSLVVFFVDRGLQLPILIICFVCTCEYIYGCKRNETKRNDKKKANFHFIFIRYFSFGRRWFKLFSVYKILNCEWIKWQKTLRIAND